MFNLPEIPSIKQFLNKKHTDEQLITMKCLKGEVLNRSEELVLKEAIHFYELSFKGLKQVKLNDITISEKKWLTSYLEDVFNYIVIIYNDIEFNYLFRVSIVKDSFLDKGLVRNIKYLKYPPLELVKEIGKYGRANTCNSTVFYASFLPEVAILETKPKIGDRIM